nr:TspO/MBR family protein [Sphingomonas melonis]
MRAPRCRARWWRRGAAYVATAARVDRPAAALAVPFVGWLGFATLLAGRIWRDNPADGRCSA